jgi:HSP20 family protein
MNNENYENGGTATATAPEPTRNDRWYRPLVDIVEDAQELRILADMPGVSVDSLDIDFHDGLLTITGRVPQRQGEAAANLLTEYGVGDFHREFRVGESINAAGIHAEYADGVLTVHLPKVEAVKPRKISVQAK